MISGISALNSEAEAEALPTSRELLKPSLLVKSSSGFSFLGEKMGNFNEETLGEFNEGKHRGRPDCRFCEGNVAIALSSNTGSGKVETFQEKKELVDC
ncbi:hypothetical protein F3Y22_tig00111947pilonHSYRG00081 [Hibiscus syriacus]|uniref:Uncharacterized protein n=1 Tax=Hibiscus syriacus TaxID=106335 RepID=A0A6A2X829_HIBSY|nr:hypothetical protein F3Y22_tig00111947pilonHSYRG00081 [Hibiscus syriacus]